MTIPSETGRAGETGPPLVHFVGVGKTFGGSAANDDLNFEIHAGRVTALIGENGAGKTTAMNILAGLYLPDAGHVVFDGAIIRPGSPRAAVDAGIGMVHQQFKLVDSLTGLENVSLATHRGRFGQAHAVEDDIRTLVDDLGFDIDLSRQVWQMPFAARQQLEILRVLAVGARLLILDEPTSVLSPPEVQRMFDIVRRVRDSGRAVVLISHKLEEVTNIADEIIVMRAGRIVHTGPVGTTDIAGLARLMVGEWTPAATARPSPVEGAPILTVENLTVADDLGLRAVDGVSLTVRAGEIVAILGVAGNGQSELLDAIGGLRHPISGRIDAPADRGRRNFGFIPSHVHGEAIAPSLSVADNTIIGHQHHAPFGVVLAPRTVSAWARDVVARFEVSGRVAAPARTLSGGNMQRLALGRELAHRAPLIVASYPTRGLDIATATAVRGALAARAADGTGVLIASEELEETLAFATRILVMHRGRIVADRAPETLEADELGRLMTVGEPS